MDGADGAISAGAAETVGRPRRSPRSAATSSKMRNAPVKMPAANTTQYPEHGGAAGGQLGTFKFSGPQRSSCRDNKSSTRLSNESASRMKVQ